MMVITRKLLKIKILLLILAVCAPPLSAQVNRHGWNGVIVNEISPTVQIVRDGASLPIYNWGMSLYEKDEVHTGENGRAEIRFSSKGNANEVIIGPDTEVRITRTTSRYDYSVYRISVLKGKIWAKDLPSQSRKVQVNAGKSKIIPFGGEYVVEQTGDQTLAVAGSGSNIRVLDRSTERYTPMPADKITAVSADTGELMMVPVPEPLITDFQSKTGDTVKPGKEIKAIVDDRVARIDEILEQEAREAEAKKAREAALKAEREAEALRERQAAMQAKQEAEQKAREAELKARQEAARKAEQKTAPQPMAAAAPATAESQQDSGKKRAEKAESSPKTAEKSEKAGDQPMQQQSDRVAQQADAAGEEKPMQEASETKPPPARTTAQKETQPQISPVRIKREEPEQKSKPLVKTVTRPRKTPVAQRKVKKEESLLQTFKWDLVTGSAILLFSWMSTEEAKKFDDLESANENLQTSWESATTTSARNELEIKYEVNKAKMNTHQSNVTLYNNLTILLVILEGYLIYDHIFGDDADDEMADARSGRRRHPMNPHTVKLGFKDPASPSGLRLSLGWKW